MYVYVCVNGCHTALGPVTLTALSVHAPLAFGIRHWGMRGADTADGTLGVVFFHVAHVCGMGRPRGAEPYTELQLWQRARRAATRGGLQAMWDELTTTCGRLELDTDDAQTAVPTTLSSEAAAEELSAANVMHGAAEGLNQGDQPCRQRPYCSQAPL